MELTSHPFLVISVHNIKLDTSVMKYLEEEILLRGAEVVVFFCLLHILVDLKFKNLPL